MKYCIVASRGVISPALAKATLVDLLGDPHRWTEGNVIAFYSEGEPAEWAQEVPGASRISSWDDIDDSWIVLGHTEEEAVVAATKSGAKYLALDDGLVELVVVPEQEEVPVLSSTPPIDEEVSAVTAAPTEISEVPARPKRGRPRKNPLPVEKTTLAIAPEPKEEKAPAKEVAPVLPKGANVDTSFHLRQIIEDKLEKADEALLLKIVVALLIP